LFDGIREHVFNANWVEKLSGVEIWQWLNLICSLSPPKRGEGWGEGILSKTVGLLTPALSSSKEEREENSN
jgi:hypothetical protein